jgi:hypothetical protein
MKKINQNKPITVLIPLVILILTLSPSTSSACSYWPSYCNVSVPTGLVTMTVRVNEYDSCSTLTQPPDYGEFASSLSGVPAGTDIVNGAYAGYCADLLGLIDDNRYGALPYSVYLYSSVAGNLPSSLNLTQSQLNQINYILNVGTLITTWTSPAAPPTWLDIQAAIWSLLYPGQCYVDSATGLFICPNDGRGLSAPFPYGSTNTGCPYSVNQATVNAILAAAGAYGANFTPGPGQKVAIVVQPEPTTFLLSQCDPSSPYYSYCQEYVGQPMQLNIIETECNARKCIKIDKLVSVDGGKTFQKAEDCSFAPVATNDSAIYELAVKNCGDVDLQNVEITDASLGISNYSAGYLAAGQSVTITQSQIPQLSVPAVTCSLSNQFQNTATVTGASVIDGTTISASDSACVKCPPPVTPPTCTTTTTNSSKFDSTAINSGDYIWFNANFKAGGIPSAGATITFTNSTITFADNNGQTYNLQVPNGQVVFSPSAACSSTTFDASGNTWVTTVPISTSGEVFLTGLAYPVPTGFGGRIPGNVVWNGTFGTESCISINWKWGAALYSNFSTSYDALGVKSTDGNCCAYNNSDLAGTPETYESSIVGGLTAGCCGGCGTGCGKSCNMSCGTGSGLNYTGSWSCTVSPEFVCLCSCNQGSQCGSQCQSGCSGNCGSQQNRWGNGQYGSQYRFGWGGKGCTLQNPSGNCQEGSGGSSCTWRCSPESGQCGSRQSSSGWSWNASSWHWF